MPIDYLRKPKSDYQGSANDHWDGYLFRNSNSRGKKTLGQFLRWQLLDKRTNGPADATIRTRLNLIQN